MLDNTHWHRRLTRRAPDVRRQFAHKARPAGLLRSATDPNSLDFTDVIGGHHLDRNPPDPLGGIPGA
jgi:hypothetical protein